MEVRGPCLYSISNGEKGNEGEVGNTPILPGRAKIQMSDTCREIAALPMPWA